MTDLLLLNATNLPWNPIFPYAFVQVRALAARHGVSVAMRDVLGVGHDDYRAVVTRLVERHQPRMVGITLRQADSVFYGDYASPRDPPYFPVSDTERLVRGVRESTDVPIALGGFGFTTNPEELFERLRPDIGVVGEADAMLRGFADVLGGVRDGIDNLLYRRHGMLRRNPRRFGAPLGEREYDDELVDSMEAFYGHAYLYAENGPTVAIELARGCPYRCYFCTEPTVKGRQVRERDLDVVMGEVEFLVRRGLHRFWLVCSELNVGNADLALRVAERFRRLNESRIGPRARWYAYHLPRWLGRSELVELYDSGFGGGWNDFPSLDDENLRRCRVPYRVDHVIEHLGATAMAHAEASDDVPQRFSMFLGNAFSTTDTVANSLATYHDAGLAQRFRSAVIGTATRAFPVENAEAFDLTGIPLHAFHPSGEARVGDSETMTTRSDPTYYLPPAILRELGTVTAVERFFAYAERTLLTSAPSGERDWGCFLSTSGTIAWLAAHVRERLPRPIRVAGLAESLRAEFDDGLGRICARPDSELRALLLGERHSAEVRRHLLALIVHKLAYPSPPGFLALLDGLGIPYSPLGRVLASPYAIIQALLPRFDDVEAMLDAVLAEFELPVDSLDIWCFRKLLFESNVVLDARYRPFLLLRTVATQGDGRRMTAPDER